MACAAFAAAALCLFSSPVGAGPESPPNWVPELSFSYIDPASGERRQCGGDCRRFEVPPGVDLEVRVQVRDARGDRSGDPVSWDLWFDEPRRPFAGVHLADCISSDDGSVDEECWLAMLDRLDWRMWHEKTADRVCVPAEPGDCTDETLTISMRPDFDGSRGPGVYAFMLWIDRFGVHAEVDEFDNLAGPVRVKVAQLTNDEDTQLEDGTSREGSAAVFKPQTPKPFGFRVRPAEIEEPFALGSRVARATVEFVPQHPGRVEIEVEQVGVWEAMTIELRKVSTGETLFETSGKGNLRIAGDFEKIHLKDDRRMEVAVRPGHGTRGLRGTIRVSYPGRGYYVRGE
jgi:hypothetical protein